MTLVQLLSRIRRGPQRPRTNSDQSEIDERTQLLIKKWDRNLEDLSEADIEGIERRAVEGHEDEIKQAFAESDAYLAERRRKRLGE